jgi:ABC-type Mn2+/Zn2+ transport system permease subunit
MAILLGVLSVTGGLGASLQWDTASGPSIVVVAFGLFLLVRAFASLRWRKSRSAS